MNVLTALLFQSVDDLAPRIQAYREARAQSGTNLTILQSVHEILKRSIRRAQARDRVTRNVAELVTTPKGKAGRPSKALTLPKAMAVIEEAKSSRLHAYVLLSLMAGIRTEEARAHQ